MCLYYIVEIKPSGIYFKDKQQQEHNSVKAFHKIQFVMLQKYKRRVILFKMNLETSGLKII